MFNEQSSMCAESKSESASNRFLFSYSCMLRLEYRKAFVPQHNGTAHINLLKPTGHVMHQQFDIQQLYVLPVLYLCVLYLSENKQRLVPLTA